MTIDKVGVNQYINTHLFIPRLCNGSTSDSGSDCGGSNPPWGTQTEPVKRFSFFFARILAASFSGFLRSKKCELFSEQGKYL